MLKNNTKKSKFWRGFLTVNSYVLFIVLWTLIILSLGLLNRCINKSSKSALKKSYLSFLTTQLVSVENSKRFLFNSCLGLITMINTCENIKSSYKQTEVLIEIVSRADFTSKILNIQSNLSDLHKHHIYFVWLAKRLIL